MSCIGTIFLPTLTSTPCVSTNYSYLQQNSSHFPCYSQCSSDFSLCGSFTLTSVEKRQQTASFLKNSEFLFSFIIAVSLPLPTTQARDFWQRWKLEIPPSPPFGVPNGLSAACVLRRRLSALSSGSFAQPGKPRR